MKSKLSIKSPPSGPWIPFWVYNTPAARLARCGDGLHHVLVRFGKNSVAFKRSESSKAKVIRREEWNKLSSVLDTRQTMSDIMLAISHRKTGDEKHVEKPVESV